MRVFHGADAQHTLLLASPRGTLGAGVYFAATPKDAAEYGEVVHEVILDLKNPWRIDVQWESEMAHALDLDCPCAEAILSLPGGDRLLENAKAGDGFFGEDLTQTLQSLGFDGIVATYPDQSAEIVSFSSVFACQIIDQQTRKPSCRI